RELLDNQPADVVAMARVLAAGIAEPDDEQIERRGAFASTPRKAQLILRGSGLALLARTGGRLRRSLALGGTLRRLLALVGPDLFALLDLHLGLLDARRQRDRREHRLGVVEVLHTLLRGE